MNIKELRSKTGLSQKEFGKRLGLTSQSITKFEGGGKITETVQKLIRYEFAEYLPAEERLTAGVAAGTAPAHSRELEQCLEEKTALQDQLKELPHLQEQNQLLKRTVELLEDQVGLYKERVSLLTGNGNGNGNGNGKSKTA